MKKLIILLTTLLLFNFAYSQEINIRGVYTNYSLPFFTATATDTVTTSWQNLGEVINMNGYTQLNLYTTLDINSSNNVRIRALGGINDTTCIYPFVIETISSTDIKIDAEYIEFNTDADQYAIIKIETDGVPYIQLQYQAGTVGATPAQIDTVYINKIWK